MKTIGKYKIQKCEVKINTKELPIELQTIIKSSDAYNKKTITVFDYYLDNLHEDLDYINVNSNATAEIYNFLIHLGQKSLDLGCDIMAYENNIYLVESHNSNDFLSDEYFEECDYCYDVNIIGKID